jgi:hypothetical protein
MWVDQAEISFFIHEEEDEWMKQAEAAETLKSRPSREDKENSVPVCVL